MSTRATIALPTTQENYTFPLLCIKNSCRGAVSSRGEGRTNEKLTAPRSNPMTFSFVPL